MKVYTKMPRLFSGHLFLCFNKYETHLFLKENNFNTANAVYVNHDLFFSAGSKKEIKDNVYREAIFNQIRKLNYPLLIKDNVGLSSYGMQIINSFGEAKAYFNSKILLFFKTFKNSSLFINSSCLNTSTFPLFFFSVDLYSY